MDKNTRGLVLLISLVLVVFPIFIFPNRLGMPLSSGSAINMLYELVLYGSILYFFRPGTTLITLLVGSALTLVYRMILGAVFGLAISAFYSIDLSVAFALGMAKYLPAILMHVASAPFLMRPVYLNVADRLEAGKHRPRRFAKKPTGETGISTPSEKSQRFEESVLESNLEDKLSGGNSPTYSYDDNQFEKAVAYLGESSSVKLAMIVDDEGLPLACLNRSDEDAELWAPFSIVLEQKNQAIFRRFNRPEMLDKLDVGTLSSRIILRRIERVTLVILTDRNVDETIHIRIAQAVDMVKRYMSERYSPSIFARVEESYVSDS